MSTEEIRDLLERYYEALTTEKEEAGLREFFGKEDVPENLLAEREIFMALQHLTGLQGPSEDFEERILSAVHLSDDQSGKNSGRSIIFIAAIAAGLAILTGSYFFFMRHNDPHETFSDPELAYVETIKILYDVSVRLNQGTRSLETVGIMEELTSNSIDLLSVPGRIIEDKLTPLEQFSRASEIIVK